MTLSVLFIATTRTINEVEARWRHSPDQDSRTWRQEGGGKYLRSWEEVARSAWREPPIRYGTLLFRPLFLLCTHRIKNRFSVKRFCANRFFDLISPFLDCVVPVCAFQFDVIAPRRRPQTVSITYNTRFPHWPRSNTVNLLRFDRTALCMSFCVYFGFKRQCMFVSDLTEGCRGDARRDDKLFSIKDKPSPVHVSLVWPSCACSLFFMTAYKLCVCATFSCFLFVYQQ